MIFEERSEYAKYKMEAAYQALNAATILADNGFWNLAVKPIILFIILRCECPFSYE